MKTVSTIYDGKTHVAEPTTAVWTLGAPMRPEFRLEEGPDFLNHGSFGAPPRAVLEAAGRWRSRLEANPDVFFREVLPGALREAASALAHLVGARTQDLVFVENATAGMNAVLRSLSFSPGDEILAGSHVYGAVRQAIRYVCERTGAKFVEAELPLPVADAEALVSSLAGRISGRTRLLVLDHIASPTGLVFPVEQLARLARLARARGARVLVDGAHAPGQIALDIPALGVDWYVGNCHKWLFAPRPCGFLWAHESAQDGLHPLAISHDYRRGFGPEFDWTGTRDPAAWLAVVEAIRFLEDLGADRVRAYGHELAVASATKIARAWDTILDGPAAMHGSMMAIRLPERLCRGLAADREGARKLMSVLIAEQRIVVAVMPIGSALWTRISASIYNTPADYDRLASL
jgi:isopenicillin-N epimerase